MAQKSRFLQGGIRELQPGQRRYGVRIEGKKKPARIRCHNVRPAELRAGAPASLSLEDF